ncbi:outer membrane beta-barrel protein [Gilliamella sp. B2776]|uniref:OmpW family outer membrane protein n=1 Tax=unclassified Gilliamella TaxID=2685620 RepID=UPI0027A2AF96|nr:outer membrane beta-barrel protein [Gilliamella sp. B2779]MCX8654814.1 outer membrane beta-barrel protein [Gilliamella sp. B2737]MCX8656972.1 outer membrane beta-barrel protein [Gilliamella sp. B2894]MCX8665054.1 outer membrane beta-barrel protein [Gilliamella sp. B2887]MCX8691342.1 outer membrane beta-barrel protein [Gilliamella sp. B2776]MCX8694115.1 outer membrane beta-barrel protein [Gilliamella sp. B2881]MCX8696895.1 outer membrane beta-barrel protein [Gilliamella sp. B2828]MCX869764
MVKISSIAMLISMGFASSMVYAHQANEIIIRGGPVYVHPEDKSDHVKVGGAKSDLKAKVDNDTQIGLNFQYMITDNIGIELLAATPFSHQVKLGGGNSTGLSGAHLGKIKHLPPTLSAVWYPLDSKFEFQPYVGVGVNYTFFFDEKLSGEAKKAGFHGLDLDNSWGLAAQIGVDYSINQNWLINAQLRYIDIETKATTHLGNTKVTANYQLDPWVAMFGVGYKF